MAECVGRRVGRTVGIFLPLVRVAEGEAGLAIPGGLSGLRKLRVAPVARMLVDGVKVS